MHPSFVLISALLVTTSLGGMAPRAWASSSSGDDVSIEDCNGFRSSIPVGSSGSSFDLSADSNFSSEDDDMGHRGPGIASDSGSDGDFDDGEAFFVNPHRLKQPPLQQTAIPFPAVAQGVGASSDRWPRGNFILPLQDKKRASGSPFPLGRHGDDHEGSRQSGIVVYLPSPLTATGPAPYPIGKPITIRGDASFKAEALSEEFLKPFTKKQRPQGLNPQQQAQKKLARYWLFRDFFEHLPRETLKTVGRLFETIVWPYLQNPSGDKGFLRQIETPAEFQMMAGLLNKVGYQPLATLFPQQSALGKLMAFKSLQRWEVFFDLCTEGAARTPATEKVQAFLETAKTNQRKLIEHRWRIQRWFENNLATHIAAVQLPAGTSEKKLWDSVADVLHQYGVKDTAGFPGRLNLETLRRPLLDTNDAMVAMAFWLLNGAPEKAMGLFNALSAQTVKPQPSKAQWTAPTTNRFAMLFELPASNDS